ncbi:hypothetical protein E2C01_036714 [Portunus trituberculatus]|uniref:Uncharacterized protein n=1 Tax=Portunus trituberculatus TaxID=210409 RepID=A0A5B7FBZ4_PORTR|nr:hypothetical protein [Portunus trituberculatus]
MNSPASATHFRTARGGRWDTRGFQQVTTAGYIGHGHHCKGGRHTAGQRKGETPSSRTTPRATLRHLADTVANAAHSLIFTQ